MKKKLCNSFTEGDDYNKGKTFGVKSKREKLSIRESLVFKFHHAMTCCVATNAKERDCWIQFSNCGLSLMSHKCYTSYLSAFIELSWSAR